MRKAKQGGEKTNEEYRNDKATYEWLQAQKRGTAYTYKCRWGDFLRYAGMTGDEILADRRNDKDFAWEKKALASKKWAQDQGLSDNSAKLVVTTARSFFAYHRLPLQFRRPEKAHITEAHLKREDFRFALSDLKKMCDVADLGERYVVTAGKSFGLRAGDFMRLRRGDLEAYIDREVPISIGPLDTQKEGVRAFPFVDSDAQPVIVLMLEKMTREGRTGPSEKILTYSEKIQLSRVLQRLVKKAGINVGNKGVRFHCLRKFLIDRLSSFMSESKWKQICGKVVAESAYVSPDSLREDYKRAMAETCFQQAQIVPSEVLARIAALEASPEVKERQAIKQRYHLRKPLEKVDDCPDGEHCQRIVSEGELGDFLSQSWRVVATLPSGSIVIER